MKNSVGSTVVSWLRDFISEQIWLASAFFIYAFRQVTILPIVIYICHFQIIEPCKNKNPRFSPQAQLTQLTNEHVNHYVNG